MTEYAIGIGVAVGFGGAQTDAQKATQERMVRALEQAQAEGVTDPAELSRRMLEARDGAH